MVFPKNQGWTSEADPILLFKDFKLHTAQNDLQILVWHVAGARALLSTLSQNLLVESISCP